MPFYLLPSKLSSALDTSASVLLCELPRPSPAYYSSSSPLTLTVSPALAIFTLPDPLLNEDHNPLLCVPRVGIMTAGFESGWRPHGLLHSPGTSKGHNVVTDVEPEDNTQITLRKPLKTLFIGECRKRLTCMYVRHASENLTPFTHVH